MTVWDGGNFGECRGETWRLFLRGSIVDRARSMLVDVYLDLWLAERYHCQASSIDSLGLLLFFEELFVLLLGLDERLFEEICVCEKLVSACV